MHLWFIKGFTEFTYLPGMVTMKELPKKQFILPCNCHLFTFLWKTSLVGRWKQIEIGSIYGYITFEVALESAASDTSPWNCAGKNNFSCWCSLCGDHIEHLTYLTLSTVYNKVFKTHNIKDESNAICHPFVMVVLHVCISFGAVLNVETPVYTCQFTQVWFNHVKAVFWLDTFRLHWWIFTSRWLFSHDSSEMFARVLSVNHTLQAGYRHTSATGHKHEVYCFIWITDEFVLEQNSGGGAMCWHGNWVSSVHLIHTKLYMVFDCIVLLLFTCFLLSVCNQRLILGSSQ